MEILVKTTRKQKLYEKINTSHPLKGKIMLNLLFWLRGNQNVFHGGTEIHIRKVSKTDVFVDCIVTDLIIIVFQCYAYVSPQKITKISHVNAALFRRTLHS